MSKKNNKIVILIAIFAVLIAIVLYYTQIKNFIDKANTPSTSVADDVPKSAQVEFKVGGQPKESYAFTATKSGQSALELIQSEVKLDLKEYDFGTMIEGVDGLMSNEKNYWAIYQNGEYAKVGIADLKLEPGDKVELKYEKIEL